jgi:hypothetical protein
MRKVTIILIYSAIIILGVYDIVAFLQGGSDATISAILLQESRKNPAIPFAFGFLMGHLFWYNSGGEKK